MNIRDQKEVGIVTYVGLLSILEFFSFGLLAERALSAGLWSWLMGALSVLWLVSMTFALSLCTQSLSRAVLILTPMCAVILVGRLQPAAWAGALLLGIFMLFSQRAFTREVVNRVTYRATEVFPGGLRYLTMGLLVALITLALPYISGTVVNNRLQVQTRHIDPIIKPFEVVIARFIPGFTAQATIDDLLRRSLEEKLQQLPLGVTVNIDDELRSGRGQLSHQLRQPLTGQERLSTITASLINRELSAVTTTNPLLVSLGLVAVVFLTLRAILPLFIWPLLGILILLLWISRRIGLVYLAKTPVVLERLQL